MTDSKKRLDSMVGVMRKSKLTVLVLEDEPIVNFLFENILGLHGFRVLSAFSAKEALEHFRQHQEQIDLLIADLTIPDASGVNFAMQCAQRSAKLRTIVTSGTPPRIWKDRDCIAFGLLVSNRATFLQKPFTATEMLKTVRDVLGLPNDFRYTPSVLPSL